MKRLICIILTLITVFFMSACNKTGTAGTYSEKDYADLYPQESSAGETSSTNEAQLLDGETECEYNKFYEFKADGEYELTLSVEKNASKTVDGLKWYVYILDERFMGGMRYLYESNNPDITVTLDEPKTAKVNSGDYIYCFCSYNEYNATGDVEAGAYLLIERDAE